MREGSRGLLPVFCSSSEKMPTRSAVFCETLSSFMQLQLALQFRDNLGRLAEITVLLIGISRNAGTGVRH